MSEKRFDLNKKTSIMLRFVVFFIALGIAAAALTLLIVNLAHYFGADTEIGYGIYWNFNVFFNFMVSFIILPIVIMYVNSQREKLKEES